VLAFIKIRKRGRGARTSSDQLALYGRIREGRAKKHGGPIFQSHKRPLQASGIGERARH